MSDIKDQFPLHWLIFENKHKELESLLNDPEVLHDLEQKDPRGRTPLLLATVLQRQECVKILLDKKCNANAEYDGWSVIQEAVCSGNKDILATILEVRDLQRHIQRVSAVPALLEKLHDAPDFYVEIKWEFQSWVPYMSRICPSDVYKVYKRGKNVRIDTTLLGFDNTSWQRGNRTYIFKGVEDSGAAMIEIDHDAREVSVEQMHSDVDFDELDAVTPSPEIINLRMTGPVIRNNIEFEKISFERNKSGFWGWRSEKSETINGYDCKVYAASNVEFVTRTRTEHLNEEQAKGIKNSWSPFQQFLGMADDDGQTTDGAAHATTPTNQDGDLASGGTEINSDPPTLEEYFSDVDLQGRDLGRPRQVNSKVQRFKANIWLSEEFPIKLQEQVLPILDLLILSSPFVAKLKDFITMQLPSGFPVKVEIPFYRIVNAVVTFGNVFGTETPVENVTVLRENNRLSCVLDDEVFRVPTNYRNKGTLNRQFNQFEDEDELMQFAIQQSLVDSENDEVDIWEALNSNSNRQPPLTPNFMTEEEALQRALQESLMAEYSNMLPLSSTTNTTTNATSNRCITAPACGTPSATYISSFEDHASYEHVLSPTDANLELAIELSREDEMRRAEELKREQEMLEEVLRLSLEEK